MSRLLVASTRAVAGGAQRALVTLVPALARLGWDIEAAVAEAGWLVDQLEAAGTPCRVGATEAVPLEEVDVVVSMGAAAHAWVGPLAAARRIPACWWLELGWRDRPAELAARSAPARAVATPTEAAGGVARAHLPDRVEVVTIAPGVEVGDPAADRVGAAARRCRVPGTGPLLVMVARLDPIKGQDVALDAIGRLRAEGRAVRLALVGGAIVGHEGDLVDRLHAQVDECGLGDVVAFVGHVDDPGPWHAAADIAVQASSHEAFGLSVVEALAHGTPVVATDTEGPREILAGGRYGVLVPPGDAEALARGIARVLDEPELASQLASQGPARAADFSPAACARRWDDVLRGAVGGGCGSGG